MDIIVKDTNFEIVDIIDLYESLIWTDRYQEYGDFEIYVPASNDIFSIIKENYYLECRESEHCMIVEDLRITTDVEEGNDLIITGKSLESILNRRIVWGQRTISGNLQNGIKTLLNESIISPSDSNRRISNFIFEESSDPNITGLRIEAQYTGDYIYDVISNICKTYGIGFMVYLNSDDQFVFKLYSGTDRSYAQDTNPYVVFSPNFENIINSNYLESNASLKNIALIGGEGEGEERRYTTLGSGSGLNRRELFVDARDISSNEGTEDEIPDDEYIELLQQRGAEKLAENTEVTSFEGQVETTQMFVYGEDFFNGDIVEVSDEYGHETQARITEIVMSEDRDGSSIYPTFETI